MPNQSLLYTGRVLACSQLPAMMHIARELCGGQICVTPDAATFANPETGAVDGEVLLHQRAAGQAEDRRRLLAFARDLLNSDYAGHRLTFQLFAQSPPFAHLGAVYRNFDLVGPAATRAASRPGCRERVLEPSRVGSAGHDATPASARSTPRDTYPEQQPRQRPLPGRASPATPSTCAARSAQDLDTRESVGDRRRRPPRPSRRWTTSRCCSDEAGARLEDIVKVRRLPDRHPLPRAGLPRDGRRLKGVFPVSTGLVVHRAGAARVGGRDRRHGRDPRSGRDLLAGRALRRAPAWSAWSCRPPARPSPPAARTPAPASARPPRRTSPTRGWARAARPDRRRAPAPTRRWPRWSPRRRTRATAS